MQVIDYIKATGFGITEGSRFMWSCYGPNAWFLDAGRVSSVIDRKTGIVYEASHCDEETDTCHKWIDPDYLDAYVAEAEQRKCSPWQAYDDVNYIRVDEGTILEIISRASDRG